MATEYCKKISAFPHKYEGAGIGSKCPSQILYARNCWSEKIEPKKDQRVSEESSSSNKILSKEDPLIVELAKCLKGIKSIINRQNQRKKDYREQEKKYLENFKSLDKDGKKKELKKYLDKLKLKKNLKLDEIISIKSVLVQTIKEDDKENVNDYLSELISNDYSKTVKSQQNSDRRKAENVINLICQIGFKKVNFSTEEGKRIIGNLLADTLDYLLIDIRSTYIIFRTRMNSESVFQKRSALQFLIDNYSKFPAGNSTLEDKFQKVNFKKSVGTLDNIINDWNNVTDSDEDSLDGESFVDKLVPKSHNWWWK
ncbi:Protein of unknown function [Cotesia congregata]|uniref:Uncharacterized protein n=1 Tax=Cotesia congregata TaxID=51543 RepID=A0A8J2MS70_COTCN|nr:Protein of unknown function [Cotesia congregata]